jgi:PBP1b-binding outer membrane lipoprotein LpoB
MTKKFIGIFVSALVVSGCAANDPDAAQEPSTGVTATAMPTPQSSDYQFEPSPTVTALSQEVIGMTEEEAIQTIEGVSGEEVTYRVTRRDDENYAMTMDYRINRINLEIDNGIVTKTSIG